MGNLRDKYKEGLLKIGVIKAGTLIDPDHPRLIIKDAPANL